MIRFGRTNFNDPKDLAEHSDIVAQLFLQLEALDFTRRCYQRAGDEKSLRRAYEIKKLLSKISELQAEAFSAFVTEDMMRKLWQTW